jgi:hypothetical protein
MHTTGPGFDFRRQNLRRSEARLTPTARASPVWRDIQSELSTQEQILGFD